MVELKWNLQFRSIPFCNSNSNSMAYNSNSNSNSGIDPSPGYTAVLHWVIGMKMPEAECLLVATWVKSSVWKLASTKALAWAPYCSSQFWKPSPRSFVLDMIMSLGKPVCRWPGHHHWIAGGITTEADPLISQADPLISQADPLISQNTSLSHL